MANINFPSQTPVGSVTPNNIEVDPGASITVRVMPVNGTGSNGGATNQKGYPKIADMVDGSGDVLPAFATLKPVADLTTGAVTGSAIQLKLEKVVPAFDITSSLPAYYDLVFNPYGTASTKLINLNYYEFTLAASLPVEWLTVSGGSIGID